MCGRWVSGRVLPAWTVPLCIAIVVALLGPPSPAEAVRLGFAFQLGGPSYDSGRATAIDGAGNVYVTGAFVGPVDFDPRLRTVRIASTIDPSTSSPSEDTFVAKYSPDGALIWARAFGGESDSDVGLGIGLDAAGNVYVTGDFAGTAYFRGDQSAGVATVTTARPIAGFVLKLDSNGTYLWAHALGGSGSADCHAITVDPQGGVYVTGAFGGTADFDPGQATPGDTLTSEGGGSGFVLKLDTDGHLLWVKSTGGTSAAGKGIALGLAGVYVTGDFSGTAFGATTHPVTSVGSSDVFVAQYSPTGTLRWAAAVGGVTTDQAHGIAVDPVSNGIYVAGYFTGTADFDPGPGSFPVSTDANGRGFILKLDAATNGGFGWAQAISAPGYNPAYGVACDGNGNAYVTGAGPDGVYITKLDIQGDVVWTRTTNAVGSTGWAIAVDGLGALDVTGDFSGAVDFDPGPGTLTLTDAGRGDAFVLKLVEDLPTIRAPGPQTAVKDTDRVFTAANGNQISIVAPDTGSDLRVRLTASNGALTLNPSARSGLTFQAGDGSADPSMTFTGTPGAVNAALNGLRFTPDSGFLGTAALQIVSGVASDANPAGMIRTDSDTVPITVVPGPCDPRPRVLVQPVAGGGMLQVTITPSELNGGGGGSIAALQFGTFRNARVTLNGQPISDGQAVSFIRTVAQVTFTVQRATPGQAVTVPLTVVDTCGSWRTFVGAGPAVTGV